MAVVIASLAIFLVWTYMRKSAPSPAVKPAFSSDTQFIPKGAVSLEVDQSLAAFGFSKPLPFFDERNVVQSLFENTTSAASVARPYLSYRVSNESEETLRAAYTKYFKDMRWNVSESVSGAKKSLFFFAPDSSKAIWVVFIQEQDAMVVAISLFPLRARATSTAPNTP